MRGRFCAQVKASPAPTMTFALKLSPQNQEPLLGQGLWKFFTGGMNRGATKYQKMINSVFSK